MLEQAMKMMQNPLIMQQMKVMMQDPNVKERMRRMLKALGSDSALGPAGEIAVSSRRPSGGRSIAMFWSCGVWTS